MSDTWKTGSGDWFPGTIEQKETLDVGDEEREQRQYEARLRFLERQDERRQNWRKKHGWASE